MSRHDFTSAEFGARRTRVRQAVAEAGLDWMILFHPVSIHWLTGSDAKSYQAFQCLIVPAEDRPTVMLTRESERAEFEEDALIDQLETWGGPEPEDPLALFERIVGRLNLRRGRVGIEVPAYYLHPHHYLGVKSILGAALVAEPSHLVHDLKMVKSPAELAYVRRSAEIADAAMAVFAASLAEGETELAIAGSVYAALLKHGSGLPASTLNLVSGERSCFSHGAPTERRLRPGDFGNVEYGAAFKRYTATIGRQFSIGRPTPRMNELHAIALEAADALIAEIRAGVPATRPHEAAKRVIAREGLDRHRVHTSGYGLAPGFPPSWGEPVNMFGGSRHVLEAGMVLSVEPPIFIAEEKLGVRLIDNVLVTADGAELLSRHPRGMIIVD